jgi:hypothetical protein
LRSPRTCVRHYAQAAPWPRRRTIGSRTEQLVEAYFIEHCAAQYEQLFEQVIALRPARAQATAEVPSLQRPMRRSR